MKKALLISIFLAFAISGLRAQDPAVSQFYLNKLYLNPAYAGINRDLTISVTARDQWTNVPSRFRTYLAALDIGCPAKNLGIGMILYDNVEGQGLLRTISASGIFASHIPINNNIIASVALKFGVGRRYLDWSKLIFADQLDPIYGNVFQTQAQPPSEISNLILDATGGAVLRWRWGGKDRHSFSSAGIVLNHANRPVESFIGLKTRLPMRTVFHTYHHFKISSQYSGNIPRYLSAGIIYEVQQQLRTMTIGSSLTFGKNLLVGMWYRNRKFVIDNSTRDALIFNFTFHHRNFVMSYSYDMTNSELTLAKTHGTHEFNIGYTIGGAHMCKQKKKPRVDCYLFDRTGPEKPTKYKKNNRYSPWMYILP